MLGSVKTRKTGTKIGMPPLRDCSWTTKRSRQCVLKVPNASCSCSDIELATRRVLWQVHRGFLEYKRSLDKRMARSPIEKDAKESWQGSDFMNSNRSFFLSVCVCGMFLANRSCCIFVFWGLFAELPGHFGILGYQRALRELLAPGDIC